MNFLKKCENVSRRRQKVLKRECHNELGIEKPPKRTYCTVSGMLVTGVGRMPGMQGAARVAEALPTNSAPPCNHPPIVPDGEIGAF